MHVILESDDHKTIPEEEEIRSQIVKKEMSLFESTNNLKKTVPCLIYNQAQINGTRERFFSHRTICHKTQKQSRLNDESVLWLLCISIINIIEKLCQLDE